MLARGRPSGRPSLGGPRVPTWRPNLASQSGVPTCASQLGGYWGVGGVRVPTWSRKPTQTSVSIHVFFMFLKGVDEIGVLPCRGLGLFDFGYLGSALGGVCACRPRAQFVRELHTCVWGVHVGVGGPCGQGGPTWGPCGSMLGWVFGLCFGLIDSFGFEWFAWCGVQSSEGEALIGSWDFGYTQTQHYRAHDFERPNSWGSISGVPDCASQLEGGMSASQIRASQIWRPNLASQPGVPIWRPNLRVPTWGVARPVWGIY